MNVFIVAIVSALRRVNSAETICVACEIVTGPMRLRTVARNSVMPRANSAREKSGRRALNRHTNPKEPASSKLQPRTKFENAVGGTDDCVVMTAASAHHAMAMKARPPAHHPTRAHAASAGTKSTIVSSTGKSAPRCEIFGMKKNATIASASLPHPRSDGAAAIVAVVVAGAAGSVMDY